MTLDAPAEAVFAVVSDLSTFPDWLELVNRVEAVPAQPSDPGPAHIVTLRARVGPFARSKRLRMTRSAHDPEGGHVRFQRHETDGRDHSDWTMTADVGPSLDGRADRCAVSIRLRYDGRMWSSLLDGVLEAAIQRATRRLGERATR